MPDFFGADTFSYVISNDFGRLDTAFVFITVDPVNDPPIPFTLLSPEDSTIIDITLENVENHLAFSWETAGDIDSDTVWYELRIIEEISALVLLDTLVLEDTFSIAYQTIVDSARAWGDTILSTLWTVHATDGIDKTCAENSPRILVCHVNEELLALLSAEALPREYVLHQNYPNPFNPTTTIKFDLPQATDVHLIVYDILGREVARLVDQHMESGYHRMVWNGRDRYGREVPTGMYLILMVTPEYQKSMKVLMLK